MEALGEAEQETTLGLVAKEFTETNKAHKTMFQVRSNYKSFQLSLSHGFFYSGNVPESGSTGIRVDRAVCVSAPSVNEMI